MHRKRRNYNKLEKGTKQGDSISAYLFILVLKIVFLFTKDTLSQYPGGDGLTHRGKFQILKIFLG